MRDSQRLRRRGRMRRAGLSAVAAVAAGAIASAAVPAAMATGAVAGAALGTVNEVLKDHGVDDEDAAYYGDRMKNGAVFLSVDDETSGHDSARTSELLYGAGGHNSRNPRM